MYSDSFRVRIHWLIKFEYKATPVLRGTVLILVAIRLLVDIFFYMLRITLVFIAKVDNLNGVWQLWAG